jgi:hypothetical protein
VLRRDRGRVRWATTRRWWRRSTIVEAWDSLAVDVEAVGEITPGLVASVIRVSGSLKGHGEVSFGSVQVFTIDDGVIMRMREFVDVDGPVGAPKA